MLKVIRFIFNHFEENTYLVIDSATNDCAIIDPGMLNANEQNALDREIADSGAKLTQIILTHAHLDHCFGAEYVHNRYGAPVKAHKEDEFLAKKLFDQACRFGLGGIVASGLEFDVTLEEGDIIYIGQSTLKVIHVPGHSPGGIVLYSEDDKVAFVGDSIFKGSIGRTDLDGGNHATLINSLRKKILTLPEDTVLLSGHGDPTTVKNERDTNPFL